MSTADQRETLADWLAAEPFTLCMSAGFFGFFAHAGVVSALEERGLVPRRLVGASAGALVAALWASGRSAAEVCDELAQLRRAEFWDPGPGLGLLRGRRFMRRLESALGTTRFDECAVPVAVSVFDVVRRRTEVVADGELTSAVVASCAFPFLFQPVSRSGRLLSDGGILDRHGVEALEPGERTLHHHLSSRSPWRRRGSSALAPPSRPGLLALCIAELPRSGPFRLSEGRRAMEVARDRARRALERPAVEAGAA